jgi:2-hydroxychromene-2-carboxylate isomerase
VTAPVRATLFSDPACPWAYSAIPALRVLSWRYGSQLEWRLVLVGLSEDTAPALARGHTPLRGALSQVRFRRYGMPFSPEPKERLSASARACRAIIAVRLDRPGDEWLAYRTLQLANFTSSLLLDDEPELARVLDSVPGLDGQAVVGRLDDPDVTEAYEADKAETRSASRSAAELQGKTANSDGRERFTAPSVTLERDGLRLVAGGFQPVEAYDVLVANLDPALVREPVPETPEPLLRRFPEGLTTQEVTALLTRGNDTGQREAAEQALLDLVSSGKALRRPLGDDALWLARGA